MEVVHPRCAGLDVHKKTMTACVITPQGRERRSFRTLTAVLLSLVESCSAPQLPSSRLEGPRKRLVELVTVWAEQMARRRRLRDDDVQHHEVERRLAKAINRLDRQVAEMGRRLAMRFACGSAPQSSSNGGQGQVKAHAKPGEATGLE